MPDQTINQQPEPGRSKLTLHTLLDVLDNKAPLEDLQGLEEMVLSGGDVLFEQDDPGDSLYILTAGALGVRVRQNDGNVTVIDKLYPVDVVGEMALISGRPRTATVFALVDSGLMRLSRGEFEALLAQDEGAADAFYAACSPRWQRLQLFRVLRDLFGELDTPMLHDIQRKLDWRHLSNGDVLFEQGDDPDGMYIVVNGRLRVLHSSADGEPNVLTDICTAETVGEYALLTDQQRSAAVVAVRETDVVRMTSADFERLIKQYPQLFRSITRIIVERQQSQLANANRRPAESNLALIAASANLDLEAFAAGLANQLSANGRALVLTAARFDTLYGRPGAAHTPLGASHDPAIVAWLARLDREYDHIIFICDRDWSEWTRRCLSQADRILLLADPSGDPQPGEIEATVRRQQTGQRIDLVLLHRPDAASPKGTAAWLKEREGIEAFHVRGGSDADLGRLARLLSGRSIALVMSGGGARGLAYLGVYRAIEELGIPLDFVGGTSIGALMAITMAAGKSYEEIMALGQALAKPDGWKDYTLPFTSLMASRRVTNTIKEVCGQLQIEDAWLPYFCVSTNITTAQKVIHRRGPAWRAVRASLSIPGVFTPVIEDQEVLVDGGVMDNFPLEVMAELSGSRRIIGATVSSATIRKATYNYDTSLSGWRILNGRLNPLAKKVRSPSLVGTIMRTLDVNSLQRSRETVDLADLLLRLDASRWDFMDYPAYEEIAQAGYELAIEPLTAWRDRSGI